MKNETTKPHKPNQSKIWIVLTLVASFILIAAVTSTIDDFFLPGSQPGQSGNIESPDKCDNCHGGYDLAVEPAFNWRGSMMAQAGRDPLYEACLAIANQDAPESGDLCIRCHAPDGWLNGRSIPTDGSALNNNDREGVQCDFCHKLVKPSAIGENPFPLDDFYSANTWPSDQNYLSQLAVIPLTSANGMYIADDINAKRGPFSDAEARHQQLYSPFHTESAICGTCHDVSNPVYEKTLVGGNTVYAPNTFAQASPSFDPRTMFPIERTFSEWEISDFNTPGGVFVPGFGGNKTNVSTCQDCHMRDVTGYGCNKKGAPLRTDLPLHDMTGGNTFIPGLVAQLFPGDIDQAALDAGVQRATEMLQKAASMDLTVTGGGATDLNVDVKIVNNTGHKLPSGYPEGRRIWINLMAYDAGGGIVYENGAYDLNTAVLDGTTKKIYEIKPGIGENVSGVLGLPAGPSFHFVLNNNIFKDNRIPPMGATNAELELIQSPTIAYTYADNQNYDITSYTVPAADAPLVARVVARLYYQTLSKEYVDFLKTENVTNNAGNVLWDLWNANGKSAPVLMIEQEVLLQAAPVAAFSATPLSGEAPLSVTFTDESSNVPTSWLWEFGDGSPTSTEQHPVHEFVTAGSYTVSLTASNAFGSSSTNQIIQVTAPVIPLQVSGTVTRITLNGNRSMAQAEILVTDDAGIPVPGALVSAAYDGPSTGSVAGTTDGLGVVVFETKAVKNATGTWCFTVQDVTKAGYNFAGPPLDICEGAALRFANVSLKDQELPEQLQLFQNYPNPFQGDTFIQFDVPSKMNIAIQISDIHGRIVNNLADRSFDQGRYIYKWSSGNLPTGQYLIRLVSENGIQSKLMIKNR